MNVVLLGATRGMGRALARAMAERGDALFLLGRDPLELERSAADLELRGAAGKVAVAQCDLREYAEFGPALDRASEALGRLDAVVVTAGTFATQDQLEEDAVRRSDVLATNFAHTIEFCEQARVRLLARGGGTLVVFSSIAGDRARPKVALYGATKAGLSYYLDAIELRHRPRGLRVLTVKPGFIRTRLTAGLPEPPFTGEPEEVARRVLRALDRGRSRVYAPAAWWTVMFVLRRLPRRLIAWLDF